MKNSWVEKLAILVLAFSGALSLSAIAQTTDEGPGPSEQPSAPMEVGQAQPSDSGPDAQADINSSDDSQPADDAQPTEAQPGGPTGEAPARTDQGVARISLIHGDVSTQRGDSGDWSAATLNQPVMTGDKVSTSDGGRTELQLDFANTLRLGPNSTANVANLTHKNIQIQLSQGIANYTVSKDSEAEPEIDTPNVSVHPSHHDGVFRVEVRPDGDTIIIVRKGEAQIATPQGSTEVRAGDMATIRGDVNEAQYKITSAPDRDDWDEWNNDRDHLIQNANSWRHTNRYYTGTQDLDAYGRWEKVADYGDVWVPNEPDGWVPYRDGNWVWQPYYGWTWVGYEPWGWAPYHYGRWMPYGASWAWWPGPVWAGYNPFWAPAYVSFFGWGGGFGFSVGFGGWGGFGWLPLGPCDWFHPWWGGYRERYGVVNVTNVNITHIHNYGGIAPLHSGLRYSNVANFRNGRIGNAMSTVNARHFGAGRVRAMGASPQQLRGARMMAGNLPVVPTHASLSASGRAASASTIRNGGSQRFFGSARGTMARPTSFQHEQASLRQSMQQNRVGAIPAGGRTFASRGNSNMRPSAGFGARQMNNFGNRVGTNQGGTQNANRGNMRPFNAPNSNAGAARQGSRGIGESGSYRPFNAPNNNRSVSPSMGAAQRGTMQNAPAANRGGFRPFTPPNSNNRSAPSSMGTAPQRGTFQSAPRENRGGYRPFSQPNSGYRPSAPPSMNAGPQRGAYQSAPAENRGGYRPPSNSPSRQMGSTPYSNRGNNSNYWNRTAPSYGGQRSYSPGYSNEVNRGSAPRPQLDMRQPIVRRPSYGGGDSRPSYGGSGGYRAAPPSYGGSHSAPSYGGGRAPSYGGGGGGRSYGGGGGGGGRSYGGGGGHAGGGGGGHAGGGHSGGRR